MNIFLVPAMYLIFIILNYVYAGGGYVHVSTVALGDQMYQILCSWNYRQLEVANVGAGN